MTKGKFHDVLTPEQRKRFDAIKKEMDAAIKPLIDELRRSEIITAKDLAVTITAR